MTGDPTRDAIAGALAEGGREEGAAGVVDRSSQVLDAADLTRYEEGLKGSPGCDLLKTPSVVVPPRAPANMPSVEQIAYIRLMNFGRKTATELRDALAATPDMKGLIIDLRGNAGGLLKAAVNTCDMFIDEGKIVSTKRRNGRGAGYRATSGADGCACGWQG